MTTSARCAILAIIATCGLGVSRAGGSPEHGAKTAGGTSDHATKAATPSSATPDKIQYSPAKSGWKSPSAGAPGASGATGTTGATGLTLQPAPAKPASANQASDESPTDPEAIVTLLQEGNQRWVKNACTSPNTEPSRRGSTAQDGQKPFATILTCADSRLPVERMFDRGVGELFVLRVAGNVIGNELAGTIEYGVGHLHTPVLIVMGHTKCGAVAATVSHADVHGHVRDIVSSIRPAAERARRQNPSVQEADLVTAAVRENVWQSVYDLLKSSEEIRTLASEGKVKIIGAVADISTGKVEFLGEHPWQSELIISLGGTSKHESEEAAPAHAKPAEAHAEAPPAKEHEGH